MMRLFIAAFIPLLSVAAPSCSGRSDLQCNQDSVCDLSSGGICSDPGLGTGNRWCAYPDPNCPSGYRYSNVQVGDGVSGQCVAIATDGGVPSGDCKTRIAFVDSSAPSPGHPNEDVWISNLDGSGLVNLSNDAKADNTRPTWSPMGQQVAFASNRNGDYNIFVTNIDGSGLTDLTPGVQANFPLWSPDGTRLAFLGQDGISLIDANGMGQSLLVPAQSGFSTVPTAWSPDGKSILYSLTDTTNGGGPRAYVANVAGGQPLRLNTGIGFEIGGVWASSQEILLTNGNDVFTVHSDGSALNNVTMYGDITIRTVGALLFASGTNEVVYSRQTGADKANRIGSTLWHLPIKGGTAVQIEPLPLTMGLSDGTWSLSGNTVAFSRQTESLVTGASTFQVGTISLDGSHMFLFNAPNGSQATDVTLSCTMNGAP